jgi:3-oxoacyl-[acyl-carrier-protein] synthase-3
MIHTKVIATGSFVPDKVLTNFDLEQIVDTSDEWIRSRTGIEKRHIVTSEKTLDLAYEASIKALSKAGGTLQEIDLVIVATVTPDYYFPGVSQLLAKKLGLIGVMAFDINAACSGFLYALEIADKMIRSGNYHTALVVGAETLTRLTDFTDRNTCVLFGDAAGALILQKANEQGIFSIVTGSDGDEDKLLVCDNVSLRNPFEKATNKYDYIHMKGSEVFKFATRIMPKTIKQLLLQNDVKLDDLDLIVAHQANTRIIEKAAKDLSFPMEKMFVNISQYGNTSAASVPLAIDEAITKKVLKPGDLFITVAFGGGLTWGGALIRL